MASSEVDIYNLALSAIGARALLSTKDDTGREGEVCRLWYPEVRQQLLHAAPWSFATGAHRMTEAKERDVAEDWVEADPEPGWRFTYTIPTDMLRPRYLTTFDRFKLTTDTSGTAVIVSNDEEAILIYTVNHTDVGKWDANFTMAIGYALASHIALPLQGKPERARHLLELANMKIVEARASLGNENEFQYESVPEWIRARGYAISTPETRYLYPFGPLLTSTVAPTK